MEQQLERKTVNIQQKWFSIGRSVSFGELVIAVSIVVSFLFTLEKRISFLERDAAETKESFNDIKTDLKDLKKSIDILTITLKDKQDRPNN